MKHKALLSLFLVPCWLLAQLPSTDLFSLTITDAQDSVWTIDGSIEFLSSFNPKGYNNQPFNYGGNVFMTLGQFGDTQTDIGLLDMSNHTVQYITSTRSYSEYSPRIVEEDSTIYCVRVDSHGQQFLWALPIDLQHAGRAVLKEEKRVGYYQRISQDSFVIFITGQPHQLAMASRSGYRYVFTSNVGRTFLVKDDGIYFVHKLTPATWYLKRFDHSTKKSTIVRRMPEGVEDFCFINVDEVLIAKGSKLLKGDLANKVEWKTVLDLKEWGINDITRLTYHDRNLIFVERH